MMFRCERLLFLGRACYRGNLVAVCLTKLAAKQYPHTFPMFGWWFIHSNPHFTEAVPLPCLLATPLYPRQILPVPSMFNLFSSVYPNKSWQLLRLDDFPRILAIFYHFFMATSHSKPCFVVRWPCSKAWTTRICCACTKPSATASVPRRGLSGMMNGHRTMGIICWLVVSNMCFSIIYGIILPIDELI